MTLLLANRRSAGRKWAALFATVALVSGLTSVVALAAQTPPAPNAGNIVTGSTFEGADGNMLASAGFTDWSTFTGTAQKLVDNPSGSGDNAFGAGTKEDGSTVTVVNGSIPSNKVDLARAYVATEGVNGKAFVYLAWVRNGSSGSANIDFELNQASTAGFTGSRTGSVTLARTAGDLLVTYDFSGSGAPVLAVLRWLTAASGGSCFSSASYPCWGNRVALDATTGQGAVSTVSITDPLNGNSSISTGLFGEAALNLSAFFPSNGCQTLGSVLVKSRSSSSFSAEVKDFIAPTPVNISNCGTIAVAKATTPSGLSGPFNFTGGLGSFQLAAGGSSQTFPNLASASYTFVETSQAGWTFTGATCAVTSGTGSPNYSVSTGDRSVTVSVQPDQTVTCTVANLKDKASPSSTDYQFFYPQTKGTLSGHESFTGTDGSLTLGLYASSDCSTSAVYSETITIPANSTTTNWSTSNTSFAIDTSVAGTDGTYYWNGAYSGDTRNNSFTLSCGFEQFKVGP